DVMSHWLCDYSATYRRAAELAPEEGAEALESRTEVGVVDREGQPYHAGGAGPERIAGNHGDAAFNEETLGECERALRFVADVDETVEGAAGSCSDRSRRSEYIKKQVPPPLEQAPACLDHGLRARERCFGGGLRRRRGAGHDRLLQLRRQRRGGPRANEPPEPPARHRIGLRSSPDHEHPVGGRVIQERDVPTTIEHNVLVDFVAYNVNAGTLSERANRGDDFGRKHGAGRIARR